jgi:endonuclease G
MAIVGDSLQGQAEAEARERFERLAALRHRNIELIKTPGGIAVADSPDRIAKRLARLDAHRHGADPAAAEAAGQAELVTAAALAQPEGGPAGLTAPQRGVGVVLEKVINEANFIDIRYLEAGVAAARAVCRVHIADGRQSGFGTGSLVSPRLVMTNHHVLRDRDVAAASSVEFNYQDGIDGRALQTQLFELDPDTFFVADKERDFALVAVRAAEDALAQFGFNRLIGAEGKAIVGEPVTIVQHPKGEKKQIVLRENKIVHIAEDAYLHYEADTEPGSSGSPVFNDQWEVVALHHASVPAAPGSGELGAYMNEGIRISRILALLREQELAADARALADQLVAAERIVLSTAPPAAANGAAPMRAPAAPVAEARGSDPGEVRLWVPIDVTVRLGGSPSAAPAVTAAAAPAETVQEKIEIDRDYSTRRGYDSGYLGDGLDVPLPTLSPELLDKASINTQATGEPRHVLPYHHFSVVMNKERRLAFFTAVNVAPQKEQPKRETDRWIFDARIPREEQTGEPIYKSNPLERGHLVRRLDPAWGDLAKQANDDTYHFTNCTPQHEKFNKGETTWAGLEDYILFNAQNHGFRACVFCGPVFAPDDDEYRGVQLPRQFWKVAVMAKKSGGLSATAYLLTQEKLIEGLESDEEFSYGAYGTWQVQLDKIEPLTGLSFGALKDADPLAQQEGTSDHFELRSGDDLLV